MIITFVLVVGALLALFFLIRLAKGRGFGLRPSQISATFRFARWTFGHFVIW